VFEDSFSFEHLLEEARKVAMDNAAGEVDLWIVLADGSRLQAHQIVRWEQTPLIFIETSDSVVMVDPRHIVRAEIKKAPPARATGFAPPPGS
jgi:hypothetical protein